MSNNEKDLVVLIASVDEIRASITALHAELHGTRQEVNGLRGDLAGVKRSLEDEMLRIKRTVDAMESFPTPYGRPRAFHTATERQSVSKPDRRRLGYMG